MPKCPQKFWNFSVELYGRPGVAEACLELQDSHGMDVNLLLLCFWYGNSFGSFDKLLLEELVKFSITWKQGIVQPLRTVRRWMKNQTQLVSENQAAQFQSLRERIESEELSAEKIQQEMLEVITLQAVPASSDTGSKAIQANLVRLLKIYALTAEDDVQAKLNKISLAYSLLPVSPSDWGDFERYIAEIAKAKAPANQRKPTIMPLSVSPVNVSKASSNKINETPQQSIFEYLAKAAPGVSMRSSQRVMIVCDSSATLSPTGLSVNPLTPVSGPNSH